MDLHCDLGRQADVAHPAEPIEQFADVVCLRCNWHRLEPSERCHVHRGVGHEQPVEFGDLLVGNWREQSVRRTPASASSAGYCGALNDTARRQDDPGCTECRDNRGGNGLSAIGTPGCLSSSLDHHRQVGVCWRPKTEGQGKKPRVIRHGLWATRVSGEWCSRNFKLLCQPLNKRLNGLLQLRKSNPRMTQQSELNSKADTIGIPAACRHQVPVGAGQSEAPCHAVGIK
jgi:hypothetical protein